MRLANRINTGLFESVNSVMIRVFKWRENCHIIGLEFMRRMGGKTAQSDLVFEAELQYFETLMRAKPSHTRTSSTDCAYTGPCPTTFDEACTSAAFLMEFFCRFLLRIAVILISQTMFRFQLESRAHYCSKILPILRCFRCHDNRLAF